MTIHKNKFNMLTAKRDGIIDEDWKTFIAQKKACINKGDKVRFKGFLNNYYGRFMEVEFNGSLFYVNESDFEGEYYYVKSTRIPSMDPLVTKTFYYCVDKKNKRFKIESEGENYILTPLE